MPDNNESNIRSLGSSDIITGHDRESTYRLNVGLDGSSTGTIQLNGSNQYTIDSSLYQPITFAVPNTVINLCNASGTLVIKRTNGQKITVNNVEDLVTRLLVFMSANNIPFTVE